MASFIEALASETAWHMREHDLTDATVADRMGISAGRLAQILTGGENFTLDTLDNLIAALDVRCELTFHPKGR